MEDTGFLSRARSALQRYRASTHWAVALSREILWLVVVVGGIALGLYLACGTWPAVVAVESESMLPNMQVGDLVVVVAKDRFGEVRTYADGAATGYEKFGMYGDVIVYRPNGAGTVHPIIHRAMRYEENVTSFQNHVYPEPQSGYLTKGDHNLLYDQGTYYPGIGYLEPVKEEWVVGKALFSVPLLGYPTLHYVEFAAIVVVIMILYELWSGRREETAPPAGKKPRRKKR
jgi:signal peptidase